MATRKSQVEKFHAKWGKNEQDLQSMGESRLKERKEMLDKFGVADGVKELMSAGNVKEAAVVFSQEGLGSFMQMFTSTIESTIRHEVGNVVYNIEEQLEHLIERKLMEMMEGMTEGMKKLAEGMVQEVIKPVEDTPASQLLRQLEKEVFFPEVPKDIVGLKTMIEERAKVEEPVAPLLGEVSEETRKSLVEKAKEDNEEFKKFSKATKGDKPILCTSDLEILHPVIIKIMKGKHAMKLSEIIRQLEDVHNIKSTTTYSTLMQRLIKKDYNFDKVGYGLYEYKEKNFRPTV